MAESKWAALAGLGTGLSSYAGAKYAEQQREIQNKIEDKRQAALFGQQTKMQSNEFSQRAKELGIQQTNRLATLEAETADRKELADYQKGIDEGLIGARLEADKEMVTARTAANMVLGDHESDKTEDMLRLQRESEIKLRTALREKGLDGSSSSGEVLMDQLKVIGELKSQLASDVSTAEKLMTTAQGIFDPEHGDEEMSAYRAAAQTAMEEKLELIKALERQYMGRFERVLGTSPTTPEDDKRPNLSSPSPTYKDVSPGLGSFIR